MPKAIIVGATSGIGKALAEVLAEQGWELGLAGQRVERLEELCRALPVPVHTQRIDVSRPEEAIAALEALLAEMEGVDLVILSSGIGRYNPDLEWPPEEETIAVNVSGFTAMATTALRHFRARGHGHLVGISSVAAERGSRFVPAYGASKAFVGSYMEGLRGLVRRWQMPITITDIRPGFVHTEMTAGQAGMFWVVPARVAAARLAAAIRKRKRLAYVPRRWGPVAWLLRRIPRWLLERF